MTQSYKLLLSLFFLACLFSSHAQEKALDYEKELEYADYLFKIQKYDNAIYEYEKLFFRTPTKSLGQKLIVTYRESGRIKQGFTRFNEIFPDKSILDDTISFEFARYLFELNFFNECIIFLQEQNSINKYSKNILTVLCHSILGDFDAASQILKETPDNKNKELLSGLIQKHQKKKMKSPALAGLFSAVVPGTGKVYTGNWKDGIISLVFVGSSTWQSYVGFKNNGVKSAYGWIYGTLASGFYLGNIYGSSNAAKKQNEMNNIKSNNDFFQAYKVLFN